MYRDLAVPLIGIILGTLMLGDGDYVMAAEIFARDGTIHIVGLIDPGDDERFRAVVSSEIRLHTNTPVDRVRVYSPGGDLEAALNIGEQVNSLLLDTWAPSITPGGRRECYIGRTLLTFDPKTGEGDSRCECASACFFVWAAGAIREGDVIGIHRPSFRPEQFSKLAPAEAKQKYISLISKTTLFLHQWSIPQDVIDRLFSINSTSVSYVDKTTIRRLNRTIIDEQIIAKCGSVITTEQLTDEVVILKRNQAALANPTAGRPAWNLDEHRRRVDALFAKIKCSLEALRNIRFQTNMQYINMKGGATPNLQQTV